MDAVERRVFGALLEKALAASAYYPMTLPALAAACNQKSQRDPVMELDEDSVWQTIEKLRERGLVTRLLPSGNARTDRFRHEATSRFGWERAQQAVMAELLLRGPQTAAELRSHCLRMYPFETLEAVIGALQGLQEAEPPWVRPLPRAARESAQRYAHCLHPPGEEPASGPGATRAEPKADGAAGELAELRDALAALERRVAALEVARGEPRAQ